MLKSLRDLIDKRWPRQASQRGRALSLEALEDRTVPAAIYTWTGAVSSTWENVNNWIAPAGGT